MTAHPSLRHCPLCGIAMQASTGERGEVRFDCLSCQTAIVERPTDPQQKARKTS